MVMEKGILWFFKVLVLVFADESTEKRPENDGDGRRISIFDLRNDDVKEEKNGEKKQKEHLNSRRMETKTGGIEFYVADRR